jgi:hypothetical protein
MMLRYNVLLAACIVSLGACSASEPIEDAPLTKDIGQSQAALEEGDFFFRCFQAELSPEDEHACEQRSGSKVFQVGTCQVLITRKCKLREGPGGEYRCCCRTEVTQASHDCEHVTWSDIWD